MHHGHGGKKAIGIKGFMLWCCTYAAKYAAWGDASGSLAPQGFAASQAAGVQPGGCVMCDDWPALSVNHCAFDLGAQGAAPPGGLAALLRGCLDGG